MSRSRCTADHRRNSNRNGTHGEFYAFEQYGIEPDIFTLAKGLGNGLPVGAMLGKTDLQQGFGPGSHGSTFGGNLLAMAAANAVCTVLTDSLC